MNQKQHLVLIHGTFANGQHWLEMAAEFERLGFTVHTPTLRYHDLPWQECARKVGRVSLDDYVADLSALVRTLDGPPIFVGHSLGGLLAQRLAVQHEHKALVLLSPAPAASIFAVAPSTARIFYQHFLQWGFWKKPIYPPNWSQWVYGVANQQPRDLQEAGYKLLCPDSGRAYFEMVFYYLDKRGAARVDFNRVHTPVLVIGGSEDKTVVPKVSSQTASRYASGTYHELQGSDHLMIAGPYMPSALGVIKAWLAQSQLLPNTINEPDERSAGR